MTHQEVIALVEKWMNDNNSVTRDELDRAANEAWIASDAASDAYEAAAEAWISCTVVDTDDDCIDADAATSAYAKVSDNINHYHKRLEEQER